MKKIALLFFVFLLFGNIFLNGQGSFIAPDTVCVGEVLEMEYDGEGSNFCIVPSADFLAFDLSIEHMEVFPDDLGPLFSHIAKDGDNYFIFSTTFHINELVRLDFGNSLSNPPTQTTMYLDSIPGGQEGIQILNDNGHWYGFIVGGTAPTWQGEFIVRLDFGNDLTSTPTLENLGNIGNLSFPHDLFITKENDEWVGFTTNKFGFSMTRFNFGNSLSNTPTGTNLGNIGDFIQPTGLFPIKVGSKWYIFVTNENNKLSRLDFGNSLLNTPTGVNLGNIDFLNKPRDLSILKICDDFYGVLINQENDHELVILDFLGNIENTPTSTALGDFSEFEFPHGLTTSQIVDEGIGIFISSVGNKRYSRITLSPPFGWDVFCQNSISDFELSYPVSGTYNLQLTVDRGLPTQSSFCKNVVVLPVPHLDLGQDTSLCIGTPLKLKSNSPHTIWQNGDEGSFFEVDESCICTGQITEGICTTIDSIQVVFEDCESCYDFPNVFTPNGDLVNDNFLPVLKCNSETLEYHLEIFNRWGQKVFKTDNPLEGWNGKFHNQISPSDVYVWKAFFTYKKNNQVQEKIISGDVTLIR